MNSEDEEKHIQIFKVPQDANTLEQEFYQFIKELNQVFAGQLSQMKNTQQLFSQIDSLIQEKREAPTETTELGQWRYTILKSFPSEYNGLIKKIEAIATTYSRVSPQLSTKELETIATTYSPTYLRELDKSIKELKDRITTYWITLEEITKGLKAGITTYSSPRLLALNGRKKEIDINHNLQQISCTTNSQEQLIFDFYKDDKKENEIEKGLLLKLWNKKKTKNTILQEMRFWHYVLSKIQKNKDVQMAIVDVKEYQKLRGLKSYKETKKQILDDILLLSTVQFIIKVTTYNKEGKNTDTDDSIFYEKKGKNSNKAIPFKINLLRAESIKSHMGRFYLIFDDISIKSLLRYPVQLPPYYFTTRKPLEAKLIYKIQSMQNAIKYNNERYPNKRNKQNPDDFPISTENLLKATDLPTYKEVMKSPTRSTYRKIIEPLEKALNNLKEAGLYDWEYRQAGNKPIPVGQDVKKWEVFQKLYIKPKIRWMTVEPPKQLTTTDTTQQKG
jgi:hypothetical protein